MQENADTQPPPLLLEQARYLPKPEEYLTPNFKELTAKYILPYIMNGLLQVFVPAFSLYTQIRYFGAQMVQIAVPFYCLSDLCCQLLPNAWSFVAASEMYTLLIEGNMERRTLMLASYFTVLPCVAVLLGVIFAVVGKMLATQFFIPAEFHIPFIINLALYPIIHFMGHVHSMRYLAEQRMIVLMATYAFSVFLGLALEYLCYSFYLSSTPASGNLISVTTNLCIGMLFVVLHVALVFGFTLYGFVVRNVNYLKAADLLRYPAYQIKIILLQLLKCIPKFVIDATLPLSLAMSSFYINSSFKEDNLKFYAIADLFVFYFYMSAIKACSLAFGRTFYIIDNLAVSKRCYKLGVQLFAGFFISSIFCGGILLLIIYFSRSWIIQFLLPTTLDVKMAQYANEEYGQHYFSIISAGLINIFDVLPQIVSSYLLVYNNVYLILAMAIAKITISVLLMQYIAYRIGDKANYLYVLIFGEGSNIVMSAVLVFLVLAEYFVFYRKKDQSAIYSKRNSVATY